MFYGGRTENQKSLRLLHRSTRVQAMSAISRLLRALGWISPPEQGFCWGERPPQKPTNRRMSVRHPSSGNDAYLGWWKDGHLNTAPAQFRDISSGGAMVLTRDMPPDEHVWLCLAKPAGARWCPVMVIRARETSVGLVELGLAFEAPCDSDLFKSVVQRDHLA
jgi:PilZ domain